MLPRDKKSEIYRRAYMVGVLRLGFIAAPYMPPSKNWRLHTAGLQAGKEAQLTDAGMQLRQSIEKQIYTFMEATK